jgi:hypothetical protein
MLLTKSDISILFVTGELDIVLQNGATHCQDPYWGQVEQYGTLTSRMEQFT